MHTMHKTGLIQGITLAILILGLPSPTTPSLGAEDVMSGEQFIADHPESEDTGYARSQIAKLNGDTTQTSH